MTTFVPTAPAPWRDPKAAMERACRHVSGASVTLRRGTLVEAAITLGGNPEVALEAASSGLLAAAQAGGYPEEIEGEAIADFIRRWLWTRRKQLPGCNSSAYDDWARPQPKPPQVAAAPEPLPVNAADAVPLAPEAGQSPMSEHSNAKCDPPHPARKSAPTSPHRGEVKGGTAVPQVTSSQRGEVPLGHGIATGSPLPVGERSRAKLAGEGDPPSRFTVATRSNVVALESDTADAPQDP